MHDNSYFRHILTVDVTIIAGLIILISLFPLRSEAVGCDWVLQFGFTLRDMFVGLASASFFLLSTSALISFRIVFGQSTTKNRKQIEKDLKSFEIRPFNVSIGRKIFAALPYGLTFGALMLLFALAYYLMAFNMFFPDSSPCGRLLNEAMELSESISIT